MFDDDAIHPSHRKQPEPYAILCAGGFSWLTRSAEDLTFYGII